MKNQNDLIISIVAVVLALIISSVLFFTKREPVQPAAPTAVVLTPPALPEGSVTMANALPGAGAGGAGGRMGGPGGPPMGMGGPGGGGFRPAGFSGAGGGAPAGGPPSGGFRPAGFSGAGGGAPAGAMGK